MPDFKLTGRLLSAAQDALAPHVNWLYDNALGDGTGDGAELLAIVKLIATERMEPGPSSDKRPYVTCRIAQLEVPAPGPQTDLVRGAMLGMFEARTAEGTFDSLTGEVTLTGATFELTRDNMAAAEAARLKVAVTHWLEELRRIRRNDMRKDLLLHELDSVADGLQAALTGVVAGD